MASHPTPTASPAPIMVGNRGQIKSIDVWIAFYVDLKPIHLVWSELLVLVCSSVLFSECGESEEMSHTS